MSEEPPIHKAPVSRAKMLKAHLHASWVSRYFNASAVCLDVVHLFFAHVTIVRVQDLSTYYGDSPIVQPIIRAM